MIAAEAPHHIFPKIKRVVIFVGYTCNNNCMFCVAADNRIFPDKTTLEIKREIEEAYENGAKDIVFSGGECTLRKDIFQIVGFAKSLGFLNIQIQTNGRMFSSIEFCKKILLSGMLEFSPALHGPSPEVHDFLTRRKGAFRQTVLGINNIKKLGKDKIRILTNTVVTKYNFKYLSKIASLLIGLGVHQYQFAFVHALGNANKFFKEIVPRKSDCIDYVKEGLDVGIKRGVRVMAEAFPLCLMRGYTRYVSEFYMPTTEVREKGQLIERFELVRIRNGKMKFSQCRSCKYNDFCEGPWKEYPQFYGDSEFQPVKA